MNTHFPSPKHKRHFDLTRLVATSIASWAAGIVAWWNDCSHRRALERLEHLDNHVLRDIGLWREPESRLDEWWNMNPPP